MSKNNRTNNQLKPIKTKKKKHSCLQERILEVNQNLHETANQLLRPTDRISKKKGKKYSFGQSHQFEQIFKRRLNT